MKWYVISYDLNSPGKDYKQLYERIFKIAYSYVRILESTWLVRCNGTSEDIYKALSPAIDKNDTIFIAEIANNLAWKLEQETSHWLDKNIVP